MSTIPFLLLTTLSTLFAGHYPIQYVYENNVVNVTTNGNIQNSYDTLRTYDLSFNPQAESSFYELYLIKNTNVNSYNTDIRIQDDLDSGDDSYNYEFRVICEGYLPNSSLYQPSFYSNVSILINYSNSFGFYHCVLISDLSDDSYDVTFSGSISAYDVALFKPDGHLERYHHLSISFIINDSDYAYYWNNGYNQGLNDNSTFWRLDNYLFAIVDIPFYTMRHFFNDSLFGGPGLFAILMSLVTVAIIIGIIKRFLK